MKRFCDGNGALTASERNPSLSSPTRRNASRRSGPLPKAARIQRLKAQYTGKVNPSNVQWAVVQCLQSGLNIAEIADVLGMTEAEARFEVSIARQNAE